MAADDRNCPEHLWRPSELHLTLKGADLVDQCARCDAVRYVPGQAALRDERPPL